MEEAHFKTCSDAVKTVLDNEQFGDGDFWEGYKLYCFAHYSKCTASKEEFAVSKMGRVMCALQEKDALKWGAHFDEAIGQAWAEMEEYVQVRHNIDCKNLRALMEKFDDVEKLSTTTSGSLLLRLIEDDDQATDFLKSESVHLRVDSDIFEEIRGRLNQTKANLANLKQKSHLSKRRKL